MTTTTPDPGSCCRQLLALMIPADSQHQRNGHSTWPCTPTPTRRAVPARGVSSMLPSLPSRWINQADQTESKKIVSSFPSRAPRLAHTRHMHACCWNQHRAAGPVVAPTARHHLPLRVIICRVMALAHARWALAGARSLSPGTHNHWAVRVYITHSQSYWTRFSSTQYFF
jgi:hypothetical protein